VDGRAEQLAECSNVLTHGQGVSQIQSKRSKPLITGVHIWYMVTETAALHGRIGTHNPGNLGKNKEERVIYNQLETVKGGVSAVSDKSFR
jgi:hypothetical protein